MVWGKGQCFLLQVFFASRWLRRIFIMTFLLHWFSFIFPFGIVCGDA
jgi:hypothetical protein